MLGTILTDWRPKCKKQNYKNFGENTQKSCTILVEEIFYNGTAQETIKKKKTINSTVVKKISIVNTKSKVNDKLEVIIVFRFSNMWKDPLIKKKKTNSPILKMGKVLTNSEKMCLYMNVCST